MADLYTSNKAHIPKSDRPPHLKLSVPGLHSSMSSMRAHSKQSIHKINYGRSIYIETMHMDVRVHISRSAGRSTPPHLKLSVPGLHRSMLSMRPHLKQSIHKINYGRSIYIKQCTYTKVRWTPPFETVSARSLLMYVINESPFKTVNSSD